MNRNDKAIFKQIDEEAAINDEMVDFVDRATTNGSLQEDDFKTWNNPDIDEDMARDLSELARIAENMTRTDLAIVIGVALTNHPLLVFQVIAEFVISLMKRRV